jgi:hypothetical protein
VDVNHFLIYKKFEKEVNSLMKGNVERQLTKKHPNPSKSSISNFLIMKVSFKNNNM